MSTPEDLKTLEAIAAAEAAGQDPFGDDEPLTIEDDAQDDVAQQEHETADQQVADDSPATDDLPVTAEAERAALPTYKAEVPSDYQAQRTELLNAKAEAMKKLLDGEIDPADYAAEEVRVTVALEDLAAARIRAETLQEANVQSQQMYQQRAIQRLISSTKAEIDYASDKAAQQQFDTSLRVLSAQPDADGKDFADLIEDAHKMVKAMRGIQTQPKTTAERKHSGDVPVTLRSLPSASTPNTGGVLEQISRLKGPAYEAAFDKLTPAQKAALLDAD